MASKKLIILFGIIGNAISFMVYLAPVPTFRTIYIRNSTEGFQPTPYMVALLSAMLTFYYGVLKSDVFLITINSIGIGFESVYLMFFIIYAPRQSKIFTAKVIVLSFLLLTCIILCTIKFAEAHLRVAIVGWICASFSVCVFVAPLSVMRQVIITKSIQYMPYLLSFFLTLCAVAWFLYGLLIFDYFIAAPNVLGFTFGIAQIVIYHIYKDRKHRDTNDGTRTII